MRRPDSRLSKRQEKKTKQNLILSVAGIIVVLILLFKVGVPLLVNFSLFIGQQKDSSPISQSNSKDPSFIAPPIFDPIPSATNSAKISLTGSAIANQSVKIYVNGKLFDETPTKNDGSFSLIVDIQKGSNTINAKANVKGKDSNFSDSLTTTYIDSKPTLDITSPSDGQTFSKDQKSAPVSGKTSAGAKVTVNGFWAIVDENNNFSYSLPLQNGDNQIKIVATDDAGNSTEKDLKVTYNP